MQGPEEIRKELLQEIVLREKELQFLRGTLGTLDKALQAADAARARIAAAREYSVAKKALAAAEEAWNAAASQPADAIVSQKAAKAAAPEAKTTPPPVKEVKKEKLPLPVPMEEAPPPPPAPAVSAPVVPAVVAQRPVSGDRFVSQGKYVNMKLWKAIQDLLYERGQLTLEEIVHELQEGGATLGDNPFRNVSTAVSYMNDKIFHVSKRGEKMLVSLLNPSGV